MAAAPDFAIRRQKSPTKSIQTLAWAAAKGIDAVTEEDRDKNITRWVNYYGPRDAIQRFSYDDLLFAGADMDCGSHKLTARKFMQLSAGRDCAIRPLSGTRSLSRSPADQLLSVPGNPSQVKDASGIGGSIRSTNPGFGADALR
jgi:hypothetical protein